MKRQSVLTSVLFTTLVATACMNGFSAILQSSPLNAPKPQILQPEDFFVSPLASPFDEDGVFLMFPLDETQGKVLPYLIDGKTVLLPGNVRVDSAWPAAPHCMNLYLCPKGPFSQLFHLESHYSIAVEIESGRIWPFPNELGEHGDEYLSEFQFLIDTLGKEKLVDVIALEREVTGEMSVGMHESPISVARRKALPVEPLTSPFDKNGALILFPFDEIAGITIPYLINGERVQLPPDTKIEGVWPYTEPCPFVTLCPDGTYVQLYNLNTETSVKLEIESGRVWPNTWDTQLNGNELSEEFQFLLDILGEDKLVDYRALECEFSSGKPTLTALLECPMSATAP